MKLAIGNDHVAVEMKQEIKAYLEGKGIEVLDVGTNSTERFPLPHQRLPRGQAVADGAVDGGVLICGTGVGISLAKQGARHPRCVCSEQYTARLSRQHNNSNIIAFGAARHRHRDCQDDCGRVAGGQLWGGRHRRVWT